jgi:7-cyano-7-deazaguanine reductase
MAHSFTGLTLGQQQDYVDKYDPKLLQGIPRSVGRASLGAAPQHGTDLWTAYELSWLAPGGKPEVAIAEFRIPAESANLIESKSFKYYLNSFNQTQVSDWQKMAELLARDLTEVADAQVGVTLHRLEDFSRKLLSLQNQSTHNQFVNLDNQSIEMQGYKPNPGYLKKQKGQFAGVYSSHLLKSNCPVTGQPDWASIWIGWQGPNLDTEGLLKYIVSFRRHQDFHEHCVEQIYSDLLSITQPEKCWVYARYTRRGGLDINPFRSSEPMDPPMVFAPRQ